jgi:hypothetical protein
MSLVVNKENIFSLQNLDNYRKNIDNTTCEITEKYYTLISEYYKFITENIKIKNKTGTIQKYLIEIKPERFTKPPAIPQRKTKKFIDEVFQYGVNEAKWKAAFEFCQDRNMKFMVLTEKDLGIIDAK